MTNHSHNPEPVAMPAPARHHLIFSFLAVGLILVWLIPQREQLVVALARNAGFMALNHAQAVAPPIPDTTTRNGITYLERATAGNRGSPSAWRALGYLHLLRGAEGEALAAWRHTDSVASELLDKGNAAEKAGRTAEALLWYERATAVEPTLVEAWLRLGNQYELAGDRQKAEAAYNAGLSAAPGNGDLLYSLGIIQARSATVNWTNILAIADQALALDRYEHDWNRTQTHFLRGEALRGLGRQHEALAEYSLVLTRHPDDYWAALRRAEMYWLTGGEPATAERYFQSVVNLDPNSKWAYHYLGRFYATAGRVAESRAQFERALQIDPNDPVALEALSRQ